MLGLPPGALLGLVDVQKFISQSAARGAYTKVWRKPCGGNRLYTRLVGVILGPGGGGASGSKGASLGVRRGGSGGRSGGLSFFQFLFEEMPDSLILTIGAPGLGGASVTANSTTGTSGGLAGDMVVATPSGIVLASVTVGTSAAASFSAGGTVAADSRNNWHGIAGATSSASGLAGVSGVNAGPGTYNALVPPGGPAGAGLTSLDAAANGASSLSLITSGGRAGFGAAGTTESPNGGDASLRELLNIGSGGPAGGSGASNAAGDAGSGGKGGFGSGGAGGGAAQNDAGNSGAGADGGLGYMVLIAC